MNTEKVKENLTLFEQLITCAHKLFFWTFDSNLQEIHTTCTDDELHDFVAGHLLKDQLLTEYVHAGPVVLTGMKGFFFIIDFEKNIAGKLYAFHMIGPAFISDISRSELRSILSPYDLSLSIQHRLIVSLSSIPIIPVTKLYEYGLMMHYCITGEKITIGDLQYKNTDKENRIKRNNSDLTDAHGSWAMEQYILQMVEDGNMNLQKEAARMGSSVNLADLGKGDSLRQLKNVTIIFTALCTRAAIRGGLPIEISYDLSDQYIRGIEGAANVADVIELNTMMQNDFVSRVNKIKSSPELSHQIQDCCSYLRYHFRENINLATLADYIGYSPNYLSKKFHKETGMTITEYTLKLKMDTAMVILKMSSEPINRVSEELNFQSPSYFCEQFKKYTHMTPTEYRESLS